MIDLTGKRALVTGGSRGIGAATAVLLAEAGASVALTYLKRKQDAERVVAAVGDRAPRTAHRALALQADLANKADCERVVTETVAAFGGLDIFVANAGIWPDEDVPVEAMDDARWRRTLATNLDSVFYGTRAALNAMVSGARSAVADGAAATTAHRLPLTGCNGRIVIVSSTAGQRGEAYHADYAATKGAIISFVKSVCVEAAKHGITVNSVAPGWVDTEMSRRPYDAEGGAGRTKIEAGIPLGRVASAEDIAGPILFLCSDLARHITGEILNVNGGAVLAG